MQEGAYQIICEHPREKPLHRDKRVISQLEIAPHYGLWENTSLK